ncbi:hypothetical protein [Isachenkonia alkalipeptolytica]|uniref:Uncharacterized protein n=1 Tax=Isachenkonia alkalipeptolytica TaxID=2565777 RepID=A0AA44BER8_9CLOT|nr:hypothetical protein [Isachenkonia alkalipeptolytica]NBG87821.1 hypothetical protein [Isachenkonia alkalipeptolytica]
MINKNRWVLLMVILTMIFFSGCRRGEEEKPEGTEETEIEVLIKDPSNWVYFRESSFERLLEHRRYTDRRLSYEDLYREIDYRLMMEEEAVLDLFGSPNEKVEDLFAYQMYILEYDGLIIQINDYDHGVYATGYYIRSPEFTGPRGTYVGQSAGEVLLAYPLPEKEAVLGEQGQVYWGDETEYYGAHMGAIHHLEDGEITEIRYAEGTGFAGVAYEIFEGVVQSIYFFEMN